MNNNRPEQATDVDVVLDFFYDHAAHTNVVDICKALHIDDVSVNEMLLSCVAQSGQAARAHDYDKLLDAQLSIVSLSLCIGYYYAMCFIKQGKVN